MCLPNISYTTITMADTSTDKPKDKVDQLLHDQGTCSVELLKSALGDAANIAAEAKKKQLLQQYQAIDSKLNSVLSSLREARKVEAQAKKLVEAVSEAKDAFMLNGDFEAAQAALQKVAVYV